MEPNWRANTAAMRTELTQSRLPYAFSLEAYGHAVEGRMLKPGRDAPFDCRLGR